MSETKQGKTDKPRVKEIRPPYGEPDPERYIPEEDVRYEIIEGVRYELQPSPTVNHQKLSSLLFVALYTTCHLNGTILYAPLDVYLDEDNQFQPDLIFVSYENERIITEKRIEGAPDLVVEILSPSTSHNDKIRKKTQYELHGVKEYWIIDPVHRTVDQFILLEGKFALSAIYGTSGILTSPTFACISVDMEQLFKPIKPPAE